jgi:protein-L-isoaspartate O-methyltransferase
VSEAEIDHVEDLYRILQIAAGCGFIVVAVVARLVGFL